MTQGQKSYNEQRIIRISDENVEGQCINNMASVRPSLSPLKPNRFFYRPSIVASSSQSYNSSMWGRDLRMEESGRFGLRAASSASESISGIIRRKWRQEHNLRERDRRREESIMYELIRTCLSDKDIHLYLPGVNKTPENLSYHQILTISSKIVENEMREMALFNRHKELVRALEAECIKRGIALPEDRPHITCPMEKHRRYAKIVNEALRMDRW